MIVFRSLTVEGFKSFRQRQVFTFPTGTGFNLLTGVNKAEPSVGSNGSGKSTLFDCLTWALYGKTVRGLKGSHVASWRQKGITYAKLAFTVDKEAYSLARSRNGTAANALELKKGIEGGVEAKQSLIDGLVGCDYESFLATCMMGQFSEFFFDLGATEKLQVFSRILKLKLWQSKAKEAANLAKDAEAAVLKARDSILVKETELSGLACQLADERKQSQQFDAEQHDRIASALAAAESAERAFARLTAPQCPKDVTALIQADLRRTDREINDLRSELRDVNRALPIGLKRIENAKNRVCGECKQPVKVSPADLSRWEHDLELVRQRKTDLEREITDLEADQRKADIALLEKQKQFDGQFRIYDAEKKKYDLAQRDVADALRRWETSKNQINPHKGNITRLEDRQIKSEKALQELQAELKQHEQDQNGYGYWAKEFKSLRLWLIEEALQQLEIETNNSLMQLGLRNWQIQYAVEKVTAKGSIAKGFNVFIQSPESPKRVKWESFSGGESQRLRLAGALGLAKLIRDRQNIQIPLEVYDEPTLYLSDEGVSDLIQFLADRAKDEKRQIWMIEPRAVSSGEFTARYEVVRDKSGSRIRRV